MSDTAICEWCEQNESSHVLWIHEKRCRLFDRILQDVKRHKRQPLEWVRHVHTCPKHSHIHLCNACWHEYQTGTLDKKLGIDAQGYRRGDA